MTAFSRTESATALGELSWEVRTVNHRYLEMMFRIPEELRRFESDYRSRLSSRLNRGRVDAQFRYKADESLGGELDLDEQLVAQLAGLSDTIRITIPDASAPGVIDILNWPGVVKTPELDVDVLAKEANRLLEQALDEICEMRAREGENLSTMVHDRIAEAGTIIAQLEPIAAEFGNRFRERLDERLKSSPVAVDPDRLEQEVVLFLQKADVDEELDRLRMHLNEVNDVLGQGKPSGRRLDFLMQELNREANTLGSKASDARISRAAVDLKVLIEQMREQIQNVE